MQVGLLEAFSISSFFSVKAKPLKSQALQGFLKMSNVIVSKEANIYLNPTNSILFHHQLLGCFSLVSYYTH